MVGLECVAGKWCLITGSTRGIGRAIALALARNGASLLLSARNEEKLKQVAEECKKAGACQVDIMAVDLTHAKEVEALATKALSVGTMQVLVNNAGTASHAPETPLDGDPDDWERVMSVNLLAPMRLTRRLAPAMQQAGCGLIFNIASVAGIEPIPSMCAYSASKWALVGWSKACYGAAREHNIKVININPGMVMTDMAVPTIGKGALKERMMADDDIAEALLLALRLGPNATPEEITIRNVQPVWPGTNF